MAILSKPSSAAKMSLLYITLGALIDVWSGVWFWYLRMHAPANESSWYWCWGFLLTGAALLIIGLALGQIGRAARHAELPPEEVTAAEAKVQETAAAHPPVVAPVNPAAPVAPTFAATGAPGPMAIPVPSGLPKPPVVHHARQG